MQNIFPSSASVHLGHFQTETKMFEIMAVAPMKDHIALRVLCVNIIMAGVTDEGEGLLAGLEEVGVFNPVIFSIKITHCKM